MAVTRSPFSKSNDDRETPKLSDDFFNYSSPIAPVSQAIADVPDRRRELWDAAYAAQEKLDEEQPDNYASASAALASLTQADQEPSNFMKALGFIARPLTAAGRYISGGVSSAISAPEELYGYLKEVAGRGVYGNVDLPSSTFEAAMTLPEEQRAPIATKFVSVSRPDLQEMVTAGYMPTWDELYSDTGFNVTVPNIRDKVPTVDIPVLKQLQQAGMWTLDAAIELGAQSAVDPFSYVSFGAGKWAGQAGRAALSSRLLQKDALKVIEDGVSAGLVDAIDYGKVYRLGEFGLTRQQRKLLANNGIIEHAGISLNFGDRATIRGTGLLSNTIGRGATKLRYGAGRLLKPTTEIGDFFTSKSLRALTDVASGKVKGDAARTQLAHYSASVAAKAEYGKSAALLGSKYYSLINQLNESVDNNIIHRAIETGTVNNIADPVTRDLAVQLQQAFDDIRLQYNTRLQSIVEEYGLEPEFVFEMGNVDNYFYHTITPEAGRWMRKQSGEGADYISALAATFDHTPAELRRGVGSLRARKLVADGETQFMGVTLKTGTIEEINQIFRQQANVDFDWFQTDSASVLASYIDSAASNLRRIAYVDKLFEYGDDVIRKILPKYVKDEQAIAVIKETADGIKSSRNKLLRKIQNTATQRVKGNQKKTAVSASSDLKQRLAKAIDDNIALLNDSEEDVVELTKELNRLNKLLADTEKKLAKNKSKAQAEYTLVVTPLKARIDALKSAIDKGTARREAARQALIEEHVKLFPRRRNRPTNIKELAAEITGSKAKRFDQKLRALQKRKRTAERRATKASGELERITAEGEELSGLLEGVSARQGVLTEMRDINYDVDVFPDGLMYTSREHLSTTDENATAFFYDSYDDITDPIAIPAPDIQQTYDISLRLEDLQEILVGFPAAVADALVELTGDEAIADWVVRESSRLMQSPAGTQVDARVPEELHGLIGVIEGWGRSAETSEEVVSVYMDELANNVNAILELKSLEPFDPEDGMAIIEDSLRSAAQMADGEGARITVVVPDIEYGEGTKFLVSSTESWNIYSGSTDSVFAGIEQGTPIWDDVVPERAIVEPVEPAVSPSTATKAVEPSVTPSTTLKSTDGASREQSKQIVTTMFSTPSPSKERSEYLSGLLKDLRQLRNDIGGLAEADVENALKDLPEFKKSLAKFREIRRKIKAVTDLREQAFLLNVAYRESDLLAADLIEDEFADAVDFAIGMSAAGMDTPLSKTIGSYGFDEELVPFIKGAAYSATRQKPQNYARVTKAQREKLLAASDSGATQMEPAINIVEPQAPARPARGQVVSSPLDREMALVEERERIVEQLRGIEPRRETAELEAGLQQQNVADIGRQIGGLKGGQRRTEQALQRRVEQATDKTIEPQNVQGIKRIRTEAQARDKLKELRPKVNAAENKLKDAMNKDPLLKDIKDVNKQIDQVAVNMDAANAVSAQANDWENTVRPVYMEKFNRLDDLVQGAPDSGFSADATRAWFNELESVLSQINDPSILNNRQRAVYDRVFTQYYAMEADLAQMDASIDFLERQIKLLENDPRFAQMVPDILEGWQEFYGLGVQVPDEIMDEWQRGLKKLQDPTGRNQLLRGYAIYTRFFKAWAIATPGFTVRNAMTAAFNNAVAGVGLENQKIAVEFAGRLARIRTKNTERGGLEYALDWAEKKYGKQTRDELEKAYEAVITSGGGQAIDEVFRLVKLPVTAGKRQRFVNRLYNNAITRGQQRINESVEIGARMAMALDGVKRDFTLEQNAARIRRYHFDYSDLSQFDMYAKSIIPFWTFASRNMQLQLVNMITRPAMYRAYERTKEMGGERTDILPEWVENRAPIMVGENKLLMPDLPMVGLEEQAQQLGGGGLSRIVAQANPLIRAPIEGLTGESAMFGSDLRREAESVGITDRPAQALLLALNKAFRPDEPVEGLSKFGQELAPSLLPPLSQLQRYAQPTLGVLGLEGAQDALGGSERYKTRDFLTTLANYFGIPYRNMTEEELDNAVRSRIYQMEQIAREADRETITWQELVRLDREQNK